MNMPNIETRVERFVLRHFKSAQIVSQSEVYGFYNIFGETKLTQFFWLRTCSKYGHQRDTFVRVTWNEEVTKGHIHSNRKEANFFGLESFSEFVQERSKNFAVSGDALA